MVITPTIHKDWKLWRKTFSHTPCRCSKITARTFSSDLRKPFLITGKSLSPLTKICSAYEKYLTTLSKTEWQVYIYILNILPLISPVCLQNLILTSVSLLLLLYLSFFYISFCSQHWYLDYENSFGVCHIVGN